MNCLPSAAPGRSRRRHPRIAISGVLVAQDLTLGHLVRMRDISRGGFRTEAACPVAPGSTHTFRVVLADGEAWVMRATAIHCHPVVGPRSVCIVGWRAAGDPTTLRSLDRLLEAFSGKADPPESVVAAPVGTSIDAHAVDAPDQRLTPA